MNPSYFAGLDLGQAKDYSALAIAEAQGAGDERIFSIRHLQRWPLQTSYPAICADVAEMLKREPLKSAPLVADATGVGRPVIDLLRQSFSSSRLHALTITAGTVETKDKQDDVTYWTVPKRILVSTVQVLLQSNQLKIASALPEAATLVRELQNFQVKITDSAHDTYGAWREGEHDDLVLAVALACWAAKHTDMAFWPITVSHNLIAGSRVKLKSYGADSRRDDKGVTIFRMVDRVREV